MFKKFLKNSAGSTAIMLALGMTGILVGVGAAVDFGNQVYMREQMQTAMDQATLAGLSTANEVLQSGGKISTAAEKGEAAARVFLASNGTKIENITANFDFVGNNSGLTVTSQAKVAAKNNFMQLVGIKSTDLVTSSKATTTNAVGNSDYRDIYIFADVSSSM